MGIKQSELIPVGTLGPTPLTPSGKTVYVKVFQVTRSMTSATLLAALPQQASILRIEQFVGAVSNAGTTASVALSVSNNSGVISTGSLNELTAGTAPAEFPMTNLPNLDGLPGLGDIRITATYAETGTASTLGGPWNVMVEYAS